MLMFVIPTIWFSEKKRIGLHRLIEAAENSCVTAELVVDDELDYELVYVTGKVKTDQIVYDREFDLVVPKCLRIVRKVEMYQWENPNSSMMCLSDTKGWLHHHVDTS